MGITRSSPPKVLFGKDVLKMCSKFTREHSCGSVISIKLLCNFIEITPQHEYNNFRRPFLKGQIWKAASGLGETVILRLWNAYIQLSVIIYLWITISQLFVCLTTLEQQVRLTKIDYAHAPSLGTSSRKKEKKKKQECGHFEQLTSSKKSSVNLKWLVWTATERCSFF